MRIGLLGMSIIELPPESPFLKTFGGGFRQTATTGVFWMRFLNPPPQMSRELDIWRWMSTNAPKLFFGGNVNPRPPPPPKKVMGIRLLGRFVNNCTHKFNSHHCFFLWGAGGGGGWISNTTLKTTFKGRVSYHPGTPLLLRRKSHENYNFKGNV